MNLELLNALASFGTFVVIAATAIAAVVQLRHARSSNQIAALNELRDSSATDRFEAAQSFVIVGLRDIITDPRFRYELNHPGERTPRNQTLFGHINTVGNYYESMGSLVQAGLVDKELVLQIWASNVLGTWDALAPVIAIVRRTRGATTWENFEYLAVLSQDWLKMHPAGTYPRGLRRMQLEDTWLAADAAYDVTQTV